MQLCALGTAILISPTAVQVDGPVAETQRSEPSADAPDPNKQTSGHPWAVGGFVDVAYLVNANLPNNHIYRGTVGTPRTGETTVNLGVAYIKHEPNEDEPWKLEFAAQLGAATDALYAGEPTPGGSSSRFAGPQTWKHLGLANAGGLITRSGTEIGAGLFASPIGIGGF